MQVVRLSAVWDHIGACDQYYSISYAISYISYPKSYDKPYFIISSFHYHTYGTSKFVSCIHSAAVQGGRVGRKNSGAVRGHVVWKCGWGMDRV